MIIDWQQIWGGFAAWSSTSGVSIALALAFIFVALFVVRVALGRLGRVLEGKSEDSQYARRVRTLLTVARKALVIVILVVGLITILSEFGIDIGPVLTAVGVLGLAVSFGAQTLVRDVISGIFILIENNIRIGDLVDIDGHTGTVEEVGLRTIKLVDIQGDTHVIPNGQVNAFVNRSFGVSHYYFEIGVAYEEDPDRAMEVVARVGQELAADPQWADDFAGPFEVFGLDRLGDWAMVIRARATTKPLRQWAVAREFNRRLKKRFDEEGIEIPLPQTVVHQRS